MLSERTVMGLNATPAIAEVKAAVVETLGIENRAETIDATTPLLGALPELDSLAVLELVVELERRFGITVEDEELSADAFATLGALTEFVSERRS
jgi:acyl carrier protein